MHTNNNTNNNNTFFIKWLAVNRFLWKDNLKYWTYVYEKAENSNSLWILRGVLHREAFLQTHDVHLRRSTRLD